MSRERQAADQLLEKIRRFVADLTPVERQLFAALLAPGVAQAHSDQDVESFGMTGWSPADLPSALAEAIRDADIRIQM
jgi:hypothetical protein